MLLMTDISFLKLVAAGQIAFDIEIVSHKVESVVILSTKHPFSVAVPCIIEFAVQSRSDILTCRVWRGHLRIRGGRRLRASFFRAFVRRARPEQISTPQNWLSKGKRLHQRSLLSNFRIVALLQAYWGLPEAPTSRQQRSPAFSTPKAECASLCCSVSWSPSGLFFE
jgi:hypothetical protein